jgi:CPA1 family monovalent cation:H+ antiporter
MHVCTAKRASVQESALLLILLAAIVIVAVIAKRFAIPYPIAFVIAGSMLAFVPNLPPFELRPDIVFLIFLPPLLYAGGWSTDWQSFKRWIRPIVLLSIGLVIATTAAVAVVAHALVPGLGWAAAFVLGAIVSPPDAVAAGAVFQRFSVPQRIISILDGEGLINDASALVIYNFAVAAVLTGTFSPIRASFAFVAVSAGGIAIGLAFAFVIAKGMILLREFELSDYLIDNAIQLFAPFAIYLTCQAVGVSGVLATVAAGIYMSRQVGKLYLPEGRLVAYAVWDLLIFMLNGFVFLLIGLQLRSIIARRELTLRDLWIALAISALVIGVRLLWVYPAAYIPRMLFRRIRETEPFPTPAYLFVIGWSGMRGIVSLAAALALPVLTDTGKPFPGRAEILFITFCVIFATLVFQGLSLIPILKILRLASGESPEQRELEARIAALRAGIGRLRKLEPGFDSTEEWEVEGRILGEYEYRIAHLSGHLDGSIGPEAIAFDHRLQGEALIAERAEILRLRDSGDIPDEVYRKLQYDLDLADERLS